MADNGEFHDFYKYTPSKPAAVVFIVLFLLASGFHFLQMIKTRVWFFIPVIVGGIFEIIGYSARIVSSTQAPLFEDTPFIIQSLFLLLAPALFAASVYMELGRIIAVLQGDELSIVRRQWMTKIFVTGDILSFVVQGAGGGIMASGTPSNLSLGQRIIVGGLAIQLLFFGFFILVAAVFHHRMISNPTTAALSPQFPWRKHLLGLYGASTLIMARSIFRVAEYVQGAEGELLRHEVYLYVFDAAIMLILMVLLNVVHPGELSQLLKSDAGSVDLELQPKKSRSRSRGGGRLSRRGVHDPVSFADMTYARHAIATRGLA